MLRRASWPFAALILTAIGCEPPPRVIKILPPGITPESQYKPTEDQIAKAVGEPTGKAKDDAPRPKEPDAPPAIGEVPTRTTPSGLMIQVVKEGEGNEVAEKGRRVAVHYTGWLLDGGKFDSSRDRGETFQFALGEGDVIKGWDEGVRGMKVREMRRLTIPPDLAYGSRGSGGGIRKPGIPPNSTLVFDIELRGIDAATVPPVPPDDRQGGSAPATAKPGDEMPDPFSRPGR